MDYVSTRGRAASGSFSDILLSGLAPDGGLYVPDSYPRVTADELESWRSLRYADLANAVIGKFVDDIPTDALSALTHAVYSAENFANVRAGSRATDITPLRWLQPGLAL